MPCTFFDTLSGQNCNHERINKNTYDLRNKVKIINYNYKNNLKTISDPQRGKWKRDPRPMQGTTLSYTYNYNFNFNSVK